MWDDVDVTEFYSVCNNKLVYYSQYLGTYTQKVYEVCEYDGDWNREIVSGLEFLNIENMTEMPADWTTEHPDIQAEGAYYQKCSVEENGEKVYTSLTVQEWCEEFEKLLGLPAPVGANLFVTKGTYEVKNTDTDFDSCVIELALEAGKKYVISNKDKCDIILNKCDIFLCLKK